MTINESSSVVEIDPGAIAHNVAWLKEQAEGVRVLAVVKADGYGHGAVTAAEAAIAAGADGLCVALVQEGVELRRAGIEVPCWCCPNSRSSSSDNS